jgi:hypothetical protein
VNEAVFYKDKNLEQNNIGVNGGPNTFLSLMSSGTVWSNDVYTRIPGNGSKCCTEVWESLTK